MNVFEFEKKVRSSLPDYIKKARIGVAVSGGADSVSLIVALSSYRYDFDFLGCITVNHNLREETETSGDADFTQNLCRKLSVPCARYDIQRGQIEKVALEKKCGIEDAARKVRYSCFEKYIEENNLDFLCLAHNKNDRIETILMRIFQGSSALEGIPFLREKFIRPLFDISRKEIEDYLNLKSFSWHIDSTNFDNNYYRNRIRNIFVPFFEKNLTGWNSSILGLSHKIGNINSALDFYVAEAEKKCGWKSFENEICISKNEFCNFPLEIRIRLIYKAVKFLGASKRIDYSFMESFCQNLRSIQGFGIFFSIDDTKIKISPITKKIATQQGFFAIIEEKGRFLVGNSILEVKKTDNGILLEYRNNQLELIKLDFPFAFRNVNSFDRIETADGKLKNCTKVLDDWKCGSFKENIPVIQRLYGGREICCIWGSVYNFSNWIV